VQGFGLKRGALASSVAHDSHNIIAVGCNDRDLCVAVRSVIRMNGGLCVAAGGKVLAETSLPIAGLMSERPLASVALRWEGMRAAALSIGSTASEPFMVLSFLALPVIPELKLTDQGLVDVTRFETVGLFIGG
jgi:adenine deaminase